MEDYREIVKREWERFNKEEHYPNIMVLGCTGCGKSSLVNTVFGKNVAVVSDAGRGTENFDVYLGKNNNSCINLIDSKGYELGSEEGCKQYIKELNDQINGYSGTKDKVHLVWYCIQAIPPRFQDYDADVLKSLINNSQLRGKVAVIITKCDQDDEDGSAAKALRSAIYEDVSRSLTVLEVSNDPTLKLDLEKLIEWSSNHITDIEVRNMFIAAQMVNLSEKKKKASKIISGAVTAAAATGAIPIPGSDAPILTAGQVAMAAAVINCYGLNMAKGVITSLIGDVLISNLGKFAAGSILKLIPGIGTGIGAVINGGVAAAITGALGFAVSKICYGSCKRIAEGENVDFMDELDYENIKSIMTPFLKENGKKSAKDIEKIIEVEGKAE